MTFADYIYGPVRGKRKRKNLYQLHFETGLSYSTLWDLANKKKRLQLYDKAELLSEATGGRCTIKELCKLAQDEAS